MSRAAEFGQGLTRDSDQLLVEGDPFIRTKERRTEPDLAIATTELDRYMGNLETARLTLAD